MVIQRGLAIKTGKMLIAACLPFGLHLVKFVHMALVQRGMQIAEGQVTIDVIFADAFCHQIDRCHAGIPCDIGIGRRQLFLYLDEITGPALADMPAIASRTAGSNGPGLEHSH